MASTASPSDRRPGFPDGLCAAALVVFTCWYAARFVDFSRQPEEDAAMLLRYSLHLAQGEGIVWNPGERPLDGATDFLFMGGAALLYRAGLPLESAARLLGLAALALAAAAVYLSIRALFGAGRAVSLAPAVYLAVGTGPRYVGACYGTTLFTLTVALAWPVAWRATEAPPERLPRLGAVLGLMTVVMGMARPEGVFLGMLFAAAVLVMRRPAEAAAVARGFVPVFLVAGVAYFGWHWSYFGQPLPNPFYAKGGGVLHWDNVGLSLRDLVRLGGPFTLLLAAGVGFRRTRRRALFALAPLGGFALLWVLVSNETNYYMRFRHPILPVILVSWVPVWLACVGEAGARRTAAPSRSWRAAGVAAALAVTAALAAWQHRRFGRIEPQRMGLYDVARMLRPYAGRGYTLATTEAGLLPLYSEWRAVDTWGLNDRWIAHHGGISEAYLDRYRPELIAFHAYFSPEVPRDDPSIGRRGLGPRWFEMVGTLQRYAERRGYVLAAVYGQDPHDTHYYYVRPDFADAPRIVSGMRHIPYVWNGHPAADYTPPVAQVAAAHH